MWVMKDVVVVMIMRVCSKLGGVVVEKRRRCRSFVKSLGGVRVEKMAVLVSFLRSFVAGEHDR